MSRTLSSPAATQRTSEVCGRIDAVSQKWTLAQVVERVLCANPQTRAAWSAARVRAAELGQVLGAYLPGLSFDASLSRTGDNVLPNEHWVSQARLSASYLLYDFGGRDAKREQAEALLAAANLGHEAIVRDLFRNAVSTYYRLLITRGAVQAARESEAAALETVKASEARVRVGAAVPADRLQAQTAYSQRRLERIRAEGQAAALQGELAALMALPVDTELELAEPGEPLSTPFEKSMEAIDRLIELAKLRRPELAAAASRVAASQAALRVAEAAGKPVLNVQASTRYVDSGPTAGWDSSMGVSVSIPLFTGYRTTYGVSVAKAQASEAEAERDRVTHTVELDVWRALQRLKTESEAYTQAQDLLDSAKAAEKLARGRYQAGLGSVLDVLNAQANLASARQVQWQTRYELGIARADLAWAVGELVWGVFEPQKTDALKP